MTARLITEHEQAWSRVRWLLFSRLLVAITCVGGILAKESGLMRAGTWPAMSPLFWAYALLVALCVLNLLYLIIAKRTRRPARFAFVQTLIDVFFISGLIYCTGGIESYFNVLYFASILGASIIISGTSAVFFASLSTVLLSIVCAAYFYAAAQRVGLPLIHESWIQELTPRRFNDVSVYLIFQGLAFHGVALLSGGLAARLGRANIMREALLRDMSEGVLAIDTKGNIIFVNDKAKSMFGFSPEMQLDGQRWEDVFRRKSDKMLRDVLMADTMGEHEIELERGDGKIPVKIRTSFLYDDRKQRIGILGDLTPQVRMKLAEKRADYMEEIAELAAGIAHEIRNPLASIRSCVQELSQLEIADEDSKQLMDIVCRESDRLDSIISDFLQFARMRPANAKPCDISTALEEARRILEQRIGDKPIRIECDLDGALLCMGDMEQLKQVFLNLGVNAFDAMPDGGTLRITGRKLAAEGDRPGIEVSFSDTGQGISSENLPRVFSPFFTTKPSGTGMGLPVVSRIMRAHGGKVGVESAPGGGSTFRIWAPAPVGQAASASIDGNP